MRCGYQSKSSSHPRYFSHQRSDPYRPIYRGPLSLDIDLEPIPRSTKRKRKVAPVHDEDLLMGFNYVAPQHSESSQSEKELLFSTPSTSFHGHLFDLHRKGSFISINPISSGKTLYSKLPPDTMTCVADNAKNNDCGTTLKQRCENWKRCLKHGSKPRGTSKNAAKDSVGIAEIRRI